MEKEYKTNFIAAYLYKKGYEDAMSNDAISINNQNVSQHMKDAKKAYKEDVKEKRKSNPHHHSNRID